MQRLPRAAKTHKGADNVVFFRGIEILNKSILKFTRKDIEVYVVVEKAIITNLFDELTPYFSIREIDVLPSNKWTIYSNEKFSTEKNLQVIYGTSSEGPENKILLNTNNKTVIVPEEDVAWKIKYIARLVRNLSRWQLYRSGYFYLHGGAVQINGHGLAFLGKKKSGKTSSILSSLINLSADYVTNDDLTVKIDKNGAFNLLGWPRAIGIRTDVLSEFQRLEKYLKGDLFHPANQYVNEKGKVYVSPKELTKFNDSEIIPETNLSAIVFPVFNSNQNQPVIKRLEPNDAFKLLLNNVEKFPDKHSDYFIGVFEIMDMEEIKSILKTASQEIPCYQLIQSMNSINDGAKLLNEIAKDISQVSNY